MRVFHPVRPFSYTAETSESFILSHNIDKSTKMPLFLPRMDGESDTADNIALERCIFMLRATIERKGYKE